MRPVPSSLFVQCTITNGHLTHYDLTLEFDAYAHKIALSLFFFLIVFFSHKTIPLINYES